MAACIMHEIERTQATDAMLLQVETKMRIRPIQMFDYLTAVREEAQKRLECLVKPLFLLLLSPLRDVFS